MRPKVGAYVREQVERRTFRASDFFETRKGICRLLRPRLPEKTCECYGGKLPNCKRVYCGSCFEAVQRE